MSLCASACTIKRPILNFPTWTGRIKTLRCLLGTLQESPELATYTGYHTGNDKLDLLTVEAYEQRTVKDLHKCFR